MSMSEQQKQQPYQHLPKPLLSICIPTYNRAEYLEQCLEAIVHQEGFDERVEVVISDNASTDETQELVKKYQEKYGNNIIKYFRNEENLKGNMNLICVLQRATGLLRKATNDTMIYRNGALNYIMNAIEANRESKPQLYFLNKGKAKLVINTIEQYIWTLGYNLTWIGSIALWDEDCEDLSTIKNNVGTSLGHVPYLLQNFEKRKCAIIYNKSIMSGVSPYKKNISYGLHKVFYVNFLRACLVSSGKVI